VVKRLIAAAVLAGILAFAWFGLGAQAPDPQAQQQPKAARPLSVDVAKVEEKSIPYLWHAIGQVEPFHAVAIRPQVSGILREVHFTEGDEVKRGQLLFSIDAAPLQAAVAQATAQVAKDEAVLSNARWRLSRQQRLQGKSYASEQDYQNAKALVAETEAGLALDQAALKQAEIQLGYAQIHAPIDGYAGALSVKAGNLVEASQNVPLVTINQIDPALVRFSIPQAELQKVRTSRRDGGDPEARIKEKNGETRTGALVFIDNSMDPQTGTIVVKALFTNRDGALWPGEYVDLDLVSGVEPHALVIPETALQQGQNGPFVYLVRDKRVRVQPVKADRQAGKEVVVDGVKAGDLVVTRIPRRLKDGATVDIRRKGE
jgi:multidrug efflux system membrane fusion protein